MCCNLVFQLIFIVSLPLLVLVFDRQACQLLGCSTGCFKLLDFWLSTLLIFDFNPQLANREAPPTLISYTGNSNGPLPLIGGSLHCQIEHHVRDKFATPILHGIDNFKNYDIFSTYCIHNPFITSFFNVFLKFLVIVIFYTHCFS